MANQNYHWSDGFTHWSTKDEERAKIRQLIDRLSLLKGCDEKDLETLAEYFWDQGRYDGYDEGAGEDL